MFEVYGYCPMSNTLNFLLLWGNHTWAPLDTIILAIQSLDD